MEKQIQRDFYLNQLIANKDRPVCKVVTGMRRSGKSYLLFTLFYEWLLKNGKPHHKNRLGNPEKQTVSGQ